MKLRVVHSLFALLLTACNSRPAPNAPEPFSAAATIPRAAAPSFDFYLLNLSWSPEFCHTHPAAIECALHATFVLHGLWPEKKDGTYPENCSNAPGPANPAQYTDIYPDLGLLRHEWNAHGTCSGLSPDDFFATARTAFQSVAIPGVLKNLTRQMSMPPNQVLGLFTSANAAIPRASLALTCSGNYLTAVEVCLDKTLHPISCGTLRSCTSSTVRIPPP
jgi:ribonuclease T2